MTDVPAVLAGRLADLRERGLHRRLRLPAGRDFASNDYLGLADDAAWRDRVLVALAGEPLGAPASRLLRGHTPVHARLEDRLAAFKGTEASLLFSTGYQANIGVITALAGPRDRIVADRLNHASLIDAVRLSGARKVIVPHLDVEAVARALATPHDEGLTLLVTESIFSMDGDVAPLDRYADLCEEHGAALIVDDAHATGVYGAERGSGLTEVYDVAHRATAITSTFGKAFGLFGAFVAGSGTVVEYLVNRARPFIFTTAPPPMLLAAVEVVLDLVADEPDRRRRVMTQAGRLRDAVATRGLDRPGGSGPIVPVIVGGAAEAVRAAAAIQAGGFDVRAVRPPTVPDGTSRLRISVHADHTDAEIDRLAEALAQALAPVGASP